jgi:gamma-glutamyl:cysteine ligase YbdK (ATP-grasp superfamily)
MGQEIDHTEFSAEDAAAFQQCLVAETHLLGDWLEAGRFSSREPVGGFELEAWLVDEDMRPVPANEEFLRALDDPLVSPELARFNVEFNTDPKPLEGRMLSRMQGEMEEHWRYAQRVARELGYRLLMIGILPTVKEDALSLANMSALNRYHALNDRVFALRGGRPIRLAIVGRQHLRSWKTDVMLEAAATSFQIHWQLDWRQTARYYNAAMVASAAVVAAGANSPFLFGSDLWFETRIPLFEQAVDLGGYRAALRGPLRRVGFGTDYARNSLLEVFRENLEHFPVILPILFETPAEYLAHLRLHNGTIWRWNRPVIGFDPDDSPHLRIEHRVLPAGPTMADMFANAALFYGLVESLVHQPGASFFPFSQARDNFYLAAQHGLNAHVAWVDGEHHRMRPLLLKQLIPQAADGLRLLNIDAGDIGRYLGIIERRVALERTGSDWQRRFIDRHPGAFAEMTQTYYHHQCNGRPVHEWPSE